MFDTITRQRSNATATKRMLTTAVSVLAHLAILVAFVVLPLWYFTPALPTPSEIMAFVAAPPRAAAAGRRHRRRQPAADIRPNRQDQPLNCQQRRSRHRLDSRRVAAKYRHHGCVGRSRRRRAWRGSAGS